MLKNVLVVALLGLSSTAFAGGFQVKVGGSVIAPTEIQQLLQVCS
jgi:outer membrane protein